MNWVRWFEESVFEIVIGYFVVVNRICSFLVSTMKIKLNATVKAIHEKIKVPPVDRKIVIRTVRVFVSAQTEIDFVIMEDFLKSNLDSIKCSISMECILSQTSTFMITIATIA